jgi:pimeloyl-ACP methyl ester carboxylesterase
METGPGGRQIQIEDPDGNPIELFEPGSPGEVRSHPNSTTRVVLLPGAAGAAGFWTPIVERLPNEWTVTALDLPGLGSVPTRDDIRSYEDLAEYVAKIIEAPTAIVAQSMGVYVALRVALQQPHLVTHLVLVAATGGIDVMNCGAAEWRSDYAATYPHAQAWACDRVPDLSADLPTLAMPVMLIWPTADALSPLAVAERLAARIPTTSLVTFPSDDHWVVHQFPEQAAAAIRSFIQQPLHRK